MDLSILNEKTVLYYDEIGLIEYGAFKKGTIEELHNAIKINRIDELSAHLSMWNVRETSIIDFIENKLIVNLSKLRDKIKQEEELIEPHDIDYYDVVRFCEEFIPALKKELQVLKAREINEPTKYDKLVLEHIIKIADDMQRVSDYIGNKIKELSSVAAIRRLNFFISEIEKKTDLPNQAFILDKLKATLQATQQEAEQRKHQQNNDVNPRQTDVSSRQTPINSRQTEVSPRQTGAQHGQTSKETTEETNIAECCKERKEKRIEDLSYKEEFQLNLSVKDESIKMQQEQEILMRIYRLLLNYDVLDTSVVFNSFAYYLKHAYLVPFFNRKKIYWMCLVGVLKDPKYYGENWRLQCANNLGINKAKVAKIDREKVGDFYRKLMDKLPTKAK